MTGGQTNTGSFSYTLGVLNPDYLPTTFNTIDTAGYPASLSLSGLGVAMYGPLLYTTSPQIMADVTAPNGFHMRLRPGEDNHYGNITEVWSWSAGSVTATLAATNPPSVTQHPQGQTVPAHTNVQFSVTAIGTPPLSYRWSLNGMPLSGASSSRLTVSNVSPADLGVYSVLITNEFGAATSSNAVLSMYPFIAGPFEGAATHWGKPAQLSVVGWGTGPLSYQWFKDGAPIPGATDPELAFPSMHFTNAGFYSVVVNSPLGSVTNPPAQVVVNPAGVSLGLYPGLTIDGVVGYRYTIQRAIDLTDTNSWTTMTDLILTLPVQLWVDTNTDAALPGNPQRFYRVLPGQ